MPTKLEMEEHNRRIMERLGRMKDPRLHMKKKKKKIFSSLDKFKNKNKKSSNKSKKKKRIRKC